MTTRRLALVVLALAVVAVAAWLLLGKPAGRGDLTAAALANARGIALMGQYKYLPAADAFAEAAALAPGWTAPRVNRGIALYNEGGGSTNDQAKKGNFALAADEFRAVLAAEPDNTHAHYNLGVVYLSDGDLADAQRHFVRATELDPADPHAWLLRASSLPDAAESAEARRHLETALRLNPHLNAARYKLAQHALTDEAGRTRLLKDFTDLMAGDADEEYGKAYTDFGRYGLCIGALPVAPPGVGPLPLFEPVPLTVTPPPAWANPTDPLTAKVRERFGATLVRLDYDGDGRPDLLLLSATAAGDVLLHNDGGGKFTDATAALGKRASLGAAVGDFDNDGRPDLALTSAAGVTLLRNVDGRRFEDVTAAAGLDKLAGVFLTAAWADLDQDGDLDLVLCRYAADPAAAAIGLTGSPPAGGGLVVALNVGVALPWKDKAAAPLAVAFRVADGPAPLLVAGPVTGVVVTDLDGDGDPDLLVLRDNATPVVLLNDRLMRWHAGPDLPAVPAARWNGGLVIDANGDEQSDLILLSAGGTPILLVSTRDAPDENLATRFAPGALGAPALAHAQHIDLDRDGRPDLLGLSGGKPVLVQNEGGKFAPRSAAFPELMGLHAVAVGDLDGDCVPDLLTWTDAGPGLFRGKATGYSSVRVALSGRRERRDPGSPRVLRVNADGIGSRVAATAGLTRAAVELTTLSAGLGQSLLPVELGIGKAESADAIRIRWPDAMIQAELSQPACQVLHIAELSRKPTSCPVLFVWDGERFAYVTDFLGGGALGELGPTAAVRPARPTEAVKVEPGRLVPRDGKYVLKVAEPMDEVLYLDHLALDVIDHPAATSVFPDERFVGGPPYPSGELLGFKDEERVFPATATDHRGRDVTATLRERDGKRADGFLPRSWLGYAEDHFVELDFADRLVGWAESSRPTVALPSRTVGLEDSAHLTKSRRLFLVLAGWTDYAFPESIYAATQAGVPTVAPVLEQRQRDGSWKALGDLGFPAGLPRVITRDVTGLLDPAAGPVRIRTNLRVEWDQIYLAPATDPGRVTTLPVAQATLDHRGFVQEVLPGGKPPVEYDDGRLEAVAVTAWAGRLTRTGDVTPLLTAADDRLVLAGPGDEVTAEFAVPPPPPAGWVRSFVLRTRGYCKDTAPTTVTGGRVGPLPFAAMRTYPPDTPPPAGQAGYAAEWNTRPARGADRSPKR